MTIETMTPVKDIVIKDEWLQDQSLQHLFDILCVDEAQVLVAGGAVRNSLMGETVNDVDLATTLRPEVVVQRLKDVGMKAIPTGIDHGTITAVINSKPFEITTLREDVETDGRHAVVRFGLDWQRDAQRRDLTMNALYCNRCGDVFDPVGGYDDLINREVRFIGEASERIEEDALRILRFFRFFAWYGKGRPDAAGLKACSSQKTLLGSLSAERVWAELKKLLSAPDPSRALLWMRTTGVLSGILPETEKWGIDAIPGLMETETENSWQADPMLRLIAMLPRIEEVLHGLKKRLCLSNAEAGSLDDWLRSGAPDFKIKQPEFEKILYRESVEGTLYCLKLEAASQRNQSAEIYASMLNFIEIAENWNQPDFPVKGKDLLKLGHQADADMGKLLASLEEQWIKSGFTLGKDDLLGSV